MAAFIESDKKFRRMRIDVLIYPGFDELDAVAPFEVLKNAVVRGASFDVRFVAAPEKGTIVAAHGLRVDCDAALGEGPQPDILVVPGGGWIDGSAAGARAEADRGVIPTRLAEHHKAGVTLAAVCTGAMLLAAANLLRGRPAITHHGAIADLEAAGAKLVRARVVDDGDVITAGGVTSGLDLALWLVERFASPAIALAVEQQMEYERRGVVWRRQ
jgi:transcriptional regulator GlxA family with amidase domain